MVGSFTKVHLVFENEHLLDRDRADFESYWILLGYEDSSYVEYHLGCEFKAAQGELVIVDEADTFIFNEPQAFSAMVEECCCICFTATPDNCDAKGVEAKVISALKFFKCNYILD